MSHQFAGHSLDPSTVWSDLLQQSAPFLLRLTTDPKGQALATDVTLANGTALSPAGVVQVGSDGKVPALTSATAPQLWAWPVYTVLAAS